jgi:hypothetical protein
VIAESAPIDRAPRLPWHWRIASWFATIAGVLVLGYVIAHWGWRWLGPTPPPISEASVERWAPAIVASPIFGRQGAAAPAGAVAPAALSGDMRLLGVFAEKGGTGHALFRLGERGPVLVKAGEDIARDVTLVEVRPDGVRIRDRGETRDLALRTSTVAPLAANARGGRNAACAPPAGFKGSIYRLNAELLTGIASRPEGWKAHFEPVAGGLAIRAGSGFAAMLGMKPGDRIAQANGVALAGIDDILVAFVNPLVASQAVHVKGIRDGKPADWLFLNVGACPG